MGERNEPEGRNVCDGVRNGVTCDRNGVTCDRNVTRKECDREGTRHSMNGR